MQFLPPKNKRWTVVESSKPKYRGDFFLKRGDEFALKVYRDCGDAHGLAYYLVNQLNDAELRRYRREKQDDQA